MRLPKIIRIVGLAMALTGAAGCALSGTGAQYAAAFIFGLAGVALLYGAQGVANALRRL